MDGNCMCTCKRVLNFLREEDWELLLTMSIEATQVVLLKQTYTPHSRKMLTYKKIQNAPNKERPCSNQPKNWPDVGEASPTTRSLEWWRICDLELRCERVRPHSYSGAQNSHLQMLATTSLCYKIRANRLFLIMRESAESFRLRSGSVSE